MNQESNFYQYLENLNHPKVFFVPTKGNRGDELITKGIKYMLGKINLTMVDNYKKADYIIINGGGYFNSIWGVGNRILKYYRTNAPFIPLIMGPQTYQFEDNIYDEFCQICALTDAPIILFCRENYSYQHLQSYQLPKNVSVKISNDCAFELMDSEFIHQHRQQATNKYILISLRGDKESGFFWLNYLASLIIKVKKLNYLDFLISLLAKLQRLSLPLIYYGQLRKEFFRFFSPSTTLPRLYKDVSLSSSFDEFCDLIDQSAFIITDRLHVSIYAHLLHKPVILLNHHSYHKIKGVYEYSMASNSKVKLL